MTFTKQERKVIGKRDSCNEHKHVVDRGIVLDLKDIWCKGQLKCMSDMP